MCISIFIFTAAIYHSIFLGARKCCCKMHCRAQVQTIGYLLKSWSFNSKYPVKPQRSMLHNPCLLAYSQKRIDSFGFLCVIIYCNFWSSAWSVIRQMGRKGCSTSSCLLMTQKNQKHWLQQLQQMITWSPALWTVNECVGVGLREKRDLETEKEMEN